MANWLQTAKNIYGSATGKIGKAIDVVGQATGNRLPEFNISERAQYLGSQLNPVKTAYAAETPSYSTGGGSSWGPTTPQVLETNNNYRAPTTSTNNGGGGGGVPGVAEVNQQTNDYGAIIDQEFNNQMSMLNAQEGEVGVQQGIAGATAEAGAAKTKTAYQQEGQTKIGAQEQNITTGQTQGATASQQARDLFRQTQQQNIAQLSGLGISSSSVAEAMAETLGVETARRISGITGSVNEIVQNATKEIGNIKSYVSTKQAEVENDLKKKKDEIQAWANSQLSVINNARNQAATAKAQQRLELFSNAQNIVSNLTSQYQTYQQQLAQWAQQKAASLTPFTNTQSVIENFAQGMGTLQQQFDPTQYNIGGTLNQNASGNYSGSYNIKPKTTEDDEEW